MLIGDISHERFNLEIVVRRMVDPPPILKSAIVLRPVVAKSLIMF